MSDKYRILQKIDGRGCSRWYPQKKAFFFFWVMDKSPFMGETVDQVGFPCVNYCQDFIDAKDVKSIIWEPHLRNEK